MCVLLACFPPLEKHKAMNCLNTDNGVHFWAVFCLRGSHGVVATKHCTQERWYYCLFIKLQKLSNTAHDSKGAFWQCKVNRQALLLQYGEQKCCCPNKCCIVASVAWLGRPDCHASIFSGWPDQPVVPGEAEGLCPLSGVWLWELEDWYLPGHPSCDQTLRSQPGLWQCGVCLSTFHSIKHLTHWQQRLQQHLTLIHSLGFTATWGLPWIQVLAALFSLWSFSILASIQMDLKHFFSATGRGVACIYPTRNSGWAQPVLLRTLQKEMRRTEGEQTENVTWEYNQQRRSSAWPALTRLILG